MTDTTELDDLVLRARNLGAKITVVYDKSALMSEGRRIYEAIQVENMKGVDPFPMSPISAAETLRRANFLVLHGSLLVRGRSRKALNL